MYLFYIYFSKFYFTQYHLQTSGNFFSFSICLYLMMGLFYFTSEEYICVYIYIISFYLSACKSSTAHFNSQHSPPLQLFFFRFPPFFIFFQSATAKKRKESVYTGPELRAEAGEVSGSEGKGCAFQMGFAGDFLQACTIDLILFSPVATQTLTLIPAMATYLPVVLCKMPYKQYCVLQPLATHTCICQGRIQSRFGYKIKCLQLEIKSWTASQVCHYCYYYNCVSC